MHNALYGDHISLKLNKQNIFQNLVNLQNLFKAKNIHKSLMNNEKLKLLYPSVTETKKLTSFLRILKKIKYITKI